MCTLTYMRRNKGHAFSAGQCDNASASDKQVAVKAAGYKSGAGRSGLLFHRRLSTLIYSQRHRESEEKLRCDVRATCPSVGLTCCLIGLSVTCWVYLCSVFVVDPAPNACLGLQEQFMFL